MERILPVTLIGGFPGAGKTSLLHHFISEHATTPVAFFFEGADPFRLDANAIRGLCGAARRREDFIMQVPDNDQIDQIDWLIQKFAELRRKATIDRVIIEISGTTNPARIARSLNRSAPFSRFARIEQVFCVVDALDFYHGGILPQQRGEPTPFFDFQKTQIEGANLIILNKCDLVESPVRMACQNIFHQINPAAPVIETAYGELSPMVWSRAKTQLENLNDRAVEPAPDPELEIFSHRIHRPFHPQRFWEWYEADHPGLLRVKGLIWLATRNLLVGGISRTRGQSACGGAGVWWDALPREEWPTDAESLGRMQETWREPYGDRRQEITVLAEAAAIPEIARQLIGCLLTDDEFAQTPLEWLRFPDPFPAWDIGAED